jgi:hypothetical protein
MNNERDLMEFVMDFWRFWISNGRRKLVENLGRGKEERGEIVVTSVEENNLNFCWGKGKFSWEVILRGKVCDGGYKYYCGGGFKIISDPPRWKKIWGRG